MNQIQTSSTSPQTLTADDRAAILDATNSMVGDEVLRPLAPEVRQRLALFLTSTDRVSTPATGPQVREALMSLMLSFQTARSVSKAEAEALLRKYTEVLEGLPLWAIRQGFRKVERGEVDGVSLDFPPAAPRLRDVVTAVMEPVLRDRYAVRRLLRAKEAPPPNEAMAKKVNLLLKYGPNYGIGGLSANEIGIAPKPKSPPWQAPTVEQLTKHYAEHSLGFKPKPAQQEPDTRDDDFREAVGQ